MNTGQYIEISHLHNFGVAKNALLNCPVILNLIPKTYMSTARMAALDDRPFYKHVIMFRRTLNMF